MSKKEVAKNENLPSFGKFKGKFHDAVDVLERDEILIPNIWLLQAMSPAVNKDKIATSGQFMHSLTNEIWDGDKGIFLIPVKIDKKWVLKYNRKHPDQTKRNKTVEIYDGKDHPVVAKAIEEQGRYGNKKVDNPDLPEFPHQLLETYYLSAIQCTLKPGVELPKNANGPTCLDDSHLESLGPIAFVIRSTKIQPFNKWRNQKSHYIYREEGEEIELPLFAHSMHVSSFEFTDNEGQTYHKIKIEPLNDNVKDSLVNPASALWDQAEGLFNSLKHGDKKVDYATTDDGGDHVDDGEAGASNTERAKTKSYADKF